MYWEGVLFLHQAKPGKHAHQQAQIARANGLKLLVFVSAQNFIAAACSKRTAVLCGFLSSTIKATG
jgi:hypothetical protein